MIKLKYWYFSKHKVKETHEDCYQAHGIVSGHPRLQDGIDITTSIVESIKLDSENNRLIMLTHSQNEYELLLADVQLMCFEETSAILQKFNIPALDKDKCEKLAKQADEELLNKVSSVLGNNELYLQLSGVFVQKAFFRNSSGEIHEIRVTSHIGTFQDSYLISDWQHGEVDFRYWDGLMSIQPYHWSDGLEALKIDNIGDTDIQFICKSRVICKVGEITTVESSQYHGEGLLSPDVVNGKCAFGGIEE